MGAPDRAAIEQSLRGYLVKLAGAQGKAISDLQPTDALIDRGVFDSMSLLDFVIFTEKLCGIEIPGEDVHPENFGSLQAILRYLEGRL